MKSFVLAAVLALVAGPASAGSLTGKSLMCQFKWDAERFSVVADPWDKPAVDKFVEDKQRTGVCRIVTDNVKVTWEKTESGEGGLYSCGRLPGDYRCLWIRSVWTTDAPAP